MPHQLHNWSDLNLPWQQSFFTKTILEIFLLPLLSISKMAAQTKNKARKIKTFRYYRKDTFHNVSWLEITKNIPSLSLTGSLSNAYQSSWPTPISNIHVHVKSYPGAKTLEDMLWFCLAGSGGVVSRTYETSNSHLNRQVPKSWNCENLKQFSFWNAW